MALLTRLICTLSLATVMVTATGCQRSRGPSDSTGFKGMRGKHGESRQINSDDEFGWTYDQEGYNSSSALDAQTATGDNYRNPGEAGLPAYDKFAPADAEIAKLFQPVYFGTNDDVVRGKENFNKISETAQHLKANANILLFIEGHCDARGAAAFNLSLGARRANSVRNLLIEQGVEANRIFTITFGKERPAREGHNEEAWRWNRRTEYKLFHTN